MTKIELEKLLEWLIKEKDRRRGLGGYSADAPAIYDLYNVTAQLTLHIIQVQRQLNKRQRNKK